MDNNILELLVKMMSQQSQPNNQGQNPSLANYPPEAFNQQNTQNYGSNNNMMPLILSLLKNNSSLSNLLSNSSKTTKKAEYCIPFK